MQLTLYSTGCPRCTVLKKKLNEKGISFVEFTDVEQMTDMGIKRVPVLSVDGKFMEFPEAVTWVNNYNR